jgi:hypothetical protein
MTPDKKPIILVASTVYYYEELLDRVYTLLTTFGYEVWMSYKGTPPVSSNLSNLENCLLATEKCDLFLGIITPQYGTGICDDGLSITHHEMKRAIELKKPRWILAHDHVFFAHTFLNGLGYKGKEGRKKLHQPEKPILDLRTIDLFEDATISDLDYKDREGNWVQKYNSVPDAMLFATAQFSRYQEAEAFIQEQFHDLTDVSRKIGDSEGRS